MCRVFAAGGQRCSCCWSKSYRADRMNSAIFWCRTEASWLLKKSQREAMALYQAAVLLACAACTSMVWNLAEGMRGGQGWPSAAPGWTGGYACPVMLLSKLSAM